MSNLKCVFIWRPLPHIYSLGMAVFRPAKEVKPCKTTIEESSGSNMWKMKVSGAKVGSAKPLVRLTPPGSQPSSTFAESLVGGPPS
jgi:hypothetical protein